MSIINKAWRGEEKLWKIFWLGLLFLAFISALGKVLVQNLPPFALFYGLFRLAYIIWWLVSLWRCAFNVSARFWGYLARALVCLFPLAIIGLVVAGVMMGQNLIGAAECRKASMEYQHAIAQGTDADAYIKQHQSEFATCPNGMPKTVSMNNE